MSAKEGREIVAEYKRQYADYKNKGGSRSYGSWIKWKGYGKGWIFIKLLVNYQNQKVDGLLRNINIWVLMILLKNS